MSASDIFKSPARFVARLDSLKRNRYTQRLKRKGRIVRKSLSSTARDKVFKKTDGRCHICGGIIEGTWQADHVFAHSLGGQHAADNYLPAHPISNNYRWFYGPEEFQWILKLGVWLRSQIERDTRVGREAAEGFWPYEQSRARRNKRT